MRLNVCFNEMALAVSVVSTYICTGTVLLLVLVYLPGTSIFFIWGHVHSCTVHCCCIIYIYICVCVCVCVCVFIKLHITTQSGPVILVILCHSH